MHNNLREGVTRTSPPAPLDPDFIAIQALTFIGSDADRLGRFLDKTGFIPGDLRRAATDPAFLSGVMDYLVADEAVLVAFAESSSLTPTDIVAAYHRRTGP